MANKKNLISAIILIIIVVITASIYSFFKPDTQTGNKNITIVVSNGEDIKNTHKISTNEEFLRGALEQENLVVGTESEYGLFINSIDGITADETKEQWWCFTKNGNALATGVDKTPIKDGDKFEATLKTGY